ncbi:MAG: transcriptional repressor LexA [Pseudomonadota bacterium]
MTPRQQEILAFIRDFQEQTGAPPTQGEIAAFFGLKSVHGVRQHLKLMRKKGYLHLIPGKARGIRLTSPAHAETEAGVREIPLVGRIAAGRPVLAVEDVQEHLKVDAGLFPGTDLFALRVQGDSMIQAGIVEGDIAVINRQGQVDHGDIAAVIIDEEATLKRVKYEPGSVRLKAENDRYQDIVITSQDGVNVHIAGRFIGLIRPGARPKDFLS